MTDRETALGKVDVGDIFHARSPNGASLVCLATSVSETTIHARRITTQEDVQFDRKTGVASGIGAVQSRIDSVAPLPADIHDVLVELDRKYGALMELDEQSRLEDLERLKLTSAEKRALLFIDSYYSANPV